VNCLFVSKEKGCQRQRRKKILTFSRAFERHDTNPYLKVDNINQRMSKAIDFFNTLHRHVSFATFTSRASSLTSVGRTASDQDHFRLAFFRKSNSGATDRADVGAQKGFAGLESGRSSEREHGDGNGSKFHNARVS
jgi:hypothetical protein